MTGSGGDGPHQFGGPPEGGTPFAGATQVTDVSHDESHGGGGLLASVRSGGALKQYLSALAFATDRTKPV